MLEGLTRQHIRYAENESSIVSEHPWSVLECLRDCRVQMFKDIAGKQKIDAQFILWRYPGDIELWRLVVAGVDVSKLLGQWLGIAFPIAHTFAEQLLVFWKVRNC